MCCQQWRTAHRPELLCALIFCDVGAAIGRPPEAEAFQSCHCEPVTDVTDAAIRSLQTSPACRGGGPASRPVEGCVPTSSCFHQRPALPPAAPFLVPARKGGKNRPEVEDSESLPPLYLNRGCRFRGTAAQPAIKSRSPPGCSAPHSNGQKGSSPFWKSPRYHRRWMVCLSRGSGLRFTECGCCLGKCWDHYFLED